MFPENDTASLIEVSKDKYGSITSTQETLFDCYIERETQWDYVDGQAVVTGEGVIYTSSTSLTFFQDQRVKIDGKEYNLNKIFEAHSPDGFHHWELTYGT